MNYDVERHNTTIALYNAFVGKVRYRKRRIDGGACRATEVECFIGFLERRGLRLGPYLAACFSKHNWGYCPPISKLQESPYIQYFETTKDRAVQWWAWVAKGLPRKLREAGQQHIFREYKESICPGEEVLKSGFIKQGGYAECLANVDITGAYHPDSKHCGGCPLKDRCNGASEESVQSGVAE